MPPIFIGSQEIVNVGDLKIGSTDIQEVFVGSTKVFPAAAPVAVSSLDTIGFIVGGGDLTTGTLTVSSGTDRLLVVFLGHESTSIITADSLTYGGQSMTKIVNDGAGGTNSAAISLWYLDEAGIVAASSTAIVPTFSGSITEGVLFAGSLQDVNQTTPVGNSGSNNNPSSHSELAVVINDVDDGFIVGTGYTGTAISLTMVNIDDLPDSEHQEASSALCGGTIATTGTSSRSVEYDKVTGGTTNRGCIAAAAFNP